MNIREKGKRLEPVLRIGRNGLRASVIDEVKKQLLKKKIIKVKFLRQALEGRDRKELAKELAALTGSEIVQQVGFVVVLKK